MLRKIITLAALLAASVVQADPPRMVVKQIGTEYRIVPDLPTGTKFRLREPVPQGQGFFVTVTWLDSNGEPDAGRVWVAMPLMGSTPSPDPDPAPTPSPAPEPQPDGKTKPKPGKVAYCYLIYETATASPEIAAIKDAKAWKDSLTAAGIKPEVLDIDQADKVYPHCSMRARAKGLPAIVTVGADGSASAVGVPATPEAMLTFAKSIGGK
jgi:hypothetical protein